MRATWTMCFGACAAACLVATAMACDQGAGVTGVTVSGTAVPATDDAGAGQGLRWGPTGVSVPVAITSTGAPGGYVVALSAQPSNITVSPASVTLGDDGKATAYALVPYGTSGYVILSAPGASTGSVPVRGSPLVLCDPTASVATGSELGSAGQVYTVSAQALIEGSCDDQGKPLAGAIEAPPGVTLTFTLQQPTAGGSTSGSGGAGGSSGASGGDAGAAASGTSGGGAGASSTDETGLATTNILVPWGPDALLQVTGTGAIASQAIHGIGNRSPSAACTGRCSPAASMLFASRQSLVIRSYRGQRFPSRTSIHRRRETSRLVPFSPTTLGSAPPSSPFRTPEACRLPSRPS